MTASAPGAPGEGGRPGARDIPVWDPLVRLIHWSVALAVLLNATVLDPEGRPHEVAGYAVAGLVAVRLAWGLIGPGPARFATFPPNPAAALRHLRHWRAGAGTVHLSHNPLGALMVYNLWLTLLALVVTGVMMGTIRFFGIQWVEEAHEMAFDWLMISVALHVGGVVIDTLRTGVPLVRAMVTGRKRVPAGARVR
ncbi:MAG: cytochrome b/b6 domain-containing protein [Pseudooceanicola sp.]|nr:cytochrome b/b6 domain-containing protein [Pseudooceanicola sp.]